MLCFETDLKNIDFYIVMYVSFDEKSFIYLKNMNLDCENVMRIHIDNKEAYDLQELTNMLCSLSGLYNNFLIKNGYKIDKNTGRLMIQSVKEENMIFDLIAPILPIANDL